MVTIFETVYVRKARKEHTCYWCGNPIIIGESYTYFNQTDGYAFSTTRLHSDCSVAANTYSEIYEVDEFPLELHRRGCYCDETALNCKCRENPHG